MKRLSILYFLALVFSAAAEVPKVCINEVQSSNDGSYMDELKQDPDWVELYNTDTQPVALGGWFLTDKPNKPEKWWRIPDGTTIAAKGYLVIACDGRGTGLHATFSISGDGDKIALIDPNSAIVDQVEFKSIPCNCSYGRSPDGGSAFAFFATATAGKANNETSYLAPLEPVTFSVPRGVCTEAFDLELSHPSNGVKIVYTLDHSEPTMSNGTPYNESTPIRITKTTNVKAAAFLEGHLPCRNVTTHTYVFLDQVAGQVKTSAGYPDIWKEDPERLGSESSGYSGSQLAMPASYGPSKSILTNDTARNDFVEALKKAPIVSITMPDGDLFGSTDGIYIHPCSLKDAANEMRQADIEWVTGENVVGSGAGVAIHGGHSRYLTFSVKKSFTVKFRGRYGASSLDAPIMKDAGSSVKEFKTLILRAEANHHWTAMDSTSHSRYPELGTCMHDQFIRNTQKLMSGFEAEGTHVHLFLNGMYWGLYNLTDQVCDDFAASTWGGDSGDYAVQNRDGLKDGTSSTYSDLVSYMSGKSMSTRDYYEHVAGILDIDAYIDYVILETFIANEDWAGNQNNWACVWSDTRQIPIRYVVWDADMSLRDNTWNELEKTGNPMAFHAKLKSSSEYKLRFADRVYRHLYNGGLLTPTAIAARYAEMAEKVRPRVFAESARWGAYQFDNWDELNHLKSGGSSKTLYDMAAWDAEYSRLTKTWFPTRHTTYISQLKTAGLWSDELAATATITVSEDRKVTLSVPDGAKAVYYTTNGDDPREAFTGNVKGTLYEGEFPLGDQACVLKARAYDKNGTWSALAEVEIPEARGTMNRFKPTTNGENWDDDANWSWGYSPNAAGETAKIGVPTEVKSKSKTWRNIHINSNDVTVGFVEVENGGWTNRIDTGDFGGNLIFDGGTNESGKAVNATFTVTDASGAGLTMIDLDAPNVVRLDSDITFDVGNTAGAPDYGGLLLEGAWDGNGKKLEKTGAGRMTIAFTTVTALGKLQCNGGITAVETPIEVESITKSGALWVQMGSTNLEKAVESAVASADTVKPSVCLFVPMDGTAETNEVWYGGVVAANGIESTDVTVYVPAKSGGISFCGQRWKACPDATWALTNVDGRVTFQATVPPPPPVRVWINEIQSSNDQTIKDERGEDSDWVELYNAGDEAVELSGWGLSDKASKPFKWTFPSGTVLEPGAYLIVFCDGTGASGTYLHANYSLSGSGETLTLTDTDERTIDQVEFGEIPSDCSYGRPASGDGFAFFASATPGAANAETGFAPPPGPVLFSKERGLYDEPFAVTLSNADAAAEIWYTTDHSDPSPTNKTAKPYRGEAISIAETTILRATAVKPGCVPCRNIQSHSYIFLSQVADQKKPACAGTVWSDAHYCSACKKDVSGDAAACPAEYGISASAVDGPDARQRLVDALSVGTVLSITMSDREMFDPDTGLHSHPNTLDIDRAASIEWVTGNHVFGTDCGVGMQGGWARHFEITPKKSFRLKFRGRFGASKLEVPVMDDVGCEQAEFKDLILRGENNQSWGRYSDKGTSMADQVLRDLQGEMSGYQSHGTHVHLYINGLYWGLYNLCERGDADYAAIVWGGNEGDWDVLKHDDGDTEDKEDGISGMEVRDGSAEAYTNLVKYVTSKSTISQADYEEICRRIDIDAYIDYIILESYIGNQDWPNNNWIALLSKKANQPLRYLGWDLEYALFSTSLNQLTASSSYDYTSEKIHKTLAKSAEYRLRFADRVHKHFYNGGALTTEALQARYSKRAELIRKMIFAEVARWGCFYHDHYASWGKFSVLDSHYVDTSLKEGGQYSKAFTTDTWETEYTSVINFFKNRWGTFKGQLTGFKVGYTTYPLYPSVEAAEFSTNGVEALSVKLSIPTGTGISVYYTTDGSDPREAFSGDIHGTQYTAGQTITVSDTATVKARARKSDGTWSALSEIELVNPVPPTNEFLPTTNGENWDKNDNWTRGYYPNAAGETAIIGVPTAVKKDKGWRNIHVNENDITVGGVEVTNGGWTNRIDTGKSGSLTFCGEISQDGATTNDATFMVMDEANPGLAIIDLDSPNVVRLASDTTFTVSNTVGDANYGGLRIKGVIAGNGHNLEKKGLGKMTLSCTNETGDVLGNLQCSEGTLAVEKPLRVDSVTKTDTIWLKTGEADLAAAFAQGLVCMSGEGREGKLNKTKVGLFVPTTIGSDEESFYGGVFCAGDLKPGEVTIYVQNPTGDVVFCGENWSVSASATYTTKGTLTVDAVEYKTFAVSVPYFGPPREPKTIVFDAAGGLGAQVLTNVTYNEEFRAPVCSLWDLKRAFKGWKAVSGGVMGETVYQPGDIIPGLYKMDNPELVAQWEDRPSYPTDEPDTEAEIRLAVGESTNIVFKSRLNLRHWLIGSTNGFSSVKVKLSLDAVPTTDYAAYQLRTTNVANEVTLTLTGEAKGSEDIFFARQYKLQEPEHTAKFRVFIGD